MSFDAPRKSAEVILRNWGGIPIAYDNVEFDSTEQVEWCRITVAPGDSFEAAIGTDCTRHIGLVVIQIFGKQWNGSSTTRERADEIAGLFRGVVEDGIFYRAANLIRVGHEQDFYQMNVSIPYQHDVYAGQLVVPDPVVHFGEQVTYLAEEVHHVH